MSSTYRILCLSHDPAITITDPGYNRPEQAEAAIHDGIEGHHGCDLMIGRYSYPLVELGCPATRDQPANLPCCHASTAWTDSDWLRLLAAAYQSDDPVVQQASRAAATTAYRGNDSNDYASNSASPSRSSPLNPSPPRSPPQRSQQRPHYASRSQHTSTGSSPNTPNTTAPTNTHTSSTRSPTACSQP